MEKLIASILPIAGNKSDKVPLRLSTVPWPLWLSWLGVILHGKKSLVWGLAGVHAWTVGLVPSWGACERQSIDASLPLCPFLPLSKNTDIKSKKTKKQKRRLSTAAKDKLIERTSCLNLITSKCLHIQLRKSIEARNQINQVQNCIKKNSVSVTDAWDGLESGKSQAYFLRKFYC